MKSLIIDASNSGISGDMFLAALLELVPNAANIINDLKELKLFLNDITKLEIELTKTERAGIKVNQLKLEIREEKHHRQPKVLKDALNKFLDEKHFSEVGREYANHVLDSLFRAEAEVHQDLIENIHLHEISSVDTLIDILGVTKALETIGAFDKNFKIYCGKVPLGGGVINSAHGTLPVPAPATIKIIEDSELLIHNGPINSELVTPTGAALLVNLNTFNKDYFPAMNLEKVVYSTGQKRFDNFPNILQLYIGNIVDYELEQESGFLRKYLEEITLIETDVDDISGEILGNFIKIIENENVLDVQVIPGITKKNRPSHIIKVLCYPKYTFQLIEIILRELGTLGVRYNTIKRVCVDRKVEKSSIRVNEKDYSLNYKISYIQKEKKAIIINIKAEYEDLKKISGISGVPVKELQTIFQSKINQISTDFLNRINDS